MNPLHDLLLIAVTVVVSYFVGYLSGRGYLIESLYRKGHISEKVYNSLKNIIE